jgi:hypothetical protein
MESGPVCALRELANLLEPLVFRLAHGFMATMLEDPALLALAFC